MKLLAPPKIESNDFFEQSKFKLAWNLCIAAIILFSILTLVNIWNTGYWHIINAIAISISIIAYIVLKKTKKYFLICLISVIAFFVLISIVFFKINFVVHLTTPLWMLMNILFAFFTLEKKWGVIILISHFLVMFIYLYTDFQENITHLPILSNLDILNYILECSVIAAGITYLLIQFIKTNNFAANQLKSANQVLMQQNQVISLQNMEKEIMLKEIHHRVKNNLQVITSLLRLQSYEIEDENQTIVFNDAINRVKSIALIHEKMYQSDTLSKFDIENYLQSLSNELIQTLSFEYPIEINVSVNISALGSKSIVPLSLLFNELISNSIKHAFSKTKNAQINIDISEDTTSNHFTLTYFDNGNWKTNDSKSFGKELISAMTEQLEGTVKFENKPEGSFYHFKLRNLID